jgi:nucleotide-binding universal stress UspA family protein
MDTRSRIGVGVDGSDRSRAALEYAMDEAARRGSGVRVVSAIPETGYWAAAYGMTPALICELGKDLERAGRDMADAVVAGHADAQDHAGV